MQQADETYLKLPEFNRVKPRPSRSRLLIFGTILVALAVIAGLVVASYFLKDSAERAKFLTESAFSASILAVIVVQAMIYDQQRRLMQQQRDLTAIAQRAYLGIKAVNIDNPIMHNTMVINAVLFNGGQTPARHVEQKFRVGLAQGPPPPFDWNAPPTEISDAGLTASFFPANAEKRVTFPKILNVTNEDFGQFEKGTRNIYADGEVRFSDYMGINQIFSFGMICTFRDNGQFRERYQGQRDNPN